jgi:hypothetical protein
MSRTSRRSKMSKSLYQQSFKPSAVMTPSCNTFRDVLSQERPPEVHISNPNPQPGFMRFRGVRDMGYKDFLRK